MSQLSRRSLVSSAAALPALAVPAVAAPDPILAIIRRHRAEEAMCAESQRIEPTAASGRPLTGTPEYRAWEEWQGEVLDACYATKNEMVMTRPTTRQGAAALIDAFLESERGYIEDYYGEPGNVCVKLLENLRAYLAAV